MNLHRAHWTEILSIMKATETQIPQPGKGETELSNRKRKSRAIEGAVQATNTATCVKKACQHRLEAKAIVGQEVEALIEMLKDFHLSFIPQ